MDAYLCLGSPLKWFDGLRHSKEWNDLELVKSRYAWNAIIGNLSVFLRWKVRKHELRLF